MGVDARPRHLSSSLTALLDALDDDALDALAERLAPHLAERLAAGARRPDGWLDARGAAAYLGISRHALHRLSAERRLPCSQQRPGGRLYFRRDDLDRWRREAAR